jgi:hypothetical protein
MIDDRFDTVPLVCREVEVWPPWHQAPVGAVGALADPMSERREDDLADG